MATSRVTDLTDLLDEVGDIALEPSSAKVLAEFLTDIVFMASLPNKEIPPEYNVQCHCLIHHEKCLGKIVGFINHETDDIMWVCPKCVDHGTISNWRGTMWDLSNLNSIMH
jgi:hypothetical protein